MVGVGGLDCESESPDAPKTNGGGGELACTGERVGLATGEAANVNPNVGLGTGAALPFPNAFVVLNPPLLGAVKGDGGST